jgi:hypothetical protein
MNWKKTLIIIAVLAVVLGGAVWTMKRITGGCHCAVIDALSATTSVQ